MTTGQALLAVFAHPDDEVLCAAGTLALCAAHGDLVTVLCATRGEHGPIAKPTLATRETLAGIRESELRSSCAALGVHEVELLGLPDAGVRWAANERATLRDLVHFIRRLRPRTIITFGPDGLYGHPDHVAIGELTCSARKAAADPRFRSPRAASASPHHVPRLFFPVWTQDFVSELLDTLTLAGESAELWSLQPDHFTLREDSITASLDVRAVLGQKLRAILSHRTQLADNNALRLLAAHASEENERGQCFRHFAERFLAVEHFRCADGLPGAPFAYNEQ
jgi:LmbE family N-acetylglucosaminyl deacetylase